MTTSIRDIGARSSHDEALLRQFLDWCARIELRRLKSAPRAYPQCERQEGEIHAAPAH